MNPEITELVDFYTNRDTKDWFMQSDEFDRTLNSKYGALVKQARNNELDALEETAEGSLALLILLDQIPRNIFRGSRESYSSDQKAQGIAARAIARNFDQQVGRESKDKQMIYYLPLMHAEDLISQVACRALIRNIALQCPEGSEERKKFDDGMRFADGHLECILKLGRFPARNEPMERDHTEQDIEWLKTHPGGF